MMKTQNKIKKNEIKYAAQFQDKRNYYQEIFFTRGSIIIFTSSWEDVSKNFIYIRCLFLPTGHFIISTT